MATVQPGSAEHRKRVARIAATAEATGQPLALDVLVAVAAFGDLPARQTLRARSDAATFDAVLAGMLAMPDERWLPQALGESKFPEARGRILAAIEACADPATYVRLVEALSLAVPKGRKCPAEVKVLLAKLPLGIHRVTKFVAAHGTPADVDAMCIAAFDAPLTTLEEFAVAFPHRWTKPRVFEAFSPYWLRADRASAAGLKRLSTIRDHLRDAGVDPRWMKFLHDILLSSPPDEILWITVAALEIAVAKLRIKAPPALIDTLFAIAERGDDRSWEQVRELLLACPEPRFAALLVKKLDAVKDPYRTLESIAGLPQRIAAEALLPRLAAGPIAWVDKKSAKLNQERLDHIVEEIRVHMPAELSTPGSALLYRLIRNGDTAGVKRVLASGGDPNQSADGEATTPLIEAIRCVYLGGGASALAIVRALLAKGAKPRAKLNWEEHIRDVRCTRRDSAVSIAQKLLERNTPPYPFSTYTDGDEDRDWLMDAERKAILPALTKLAALLAKA